MPTILCVTPHPDDESFGPAGTIAKYTASGVPVDLLIFTRGQAGVRSDPITSPEQLGLVREYEQKAAAKVLGIRNLTFLHYMDGQLENEDLAELSGHVRDGIERSAADAIITIGPYGLTRHPDHITVHRAVMGAIEGAARPVRVFYVAVEGEWAKQMNLDGPETQATHRIDMADFFETKLTALACHTSQQDAREFFLMLSQGHQREELFHQAVPPFAGEAPKTDLFA